jgi:hypothetical protein
MVFPQLHFITIGQAIRRGHPAKESEKTRSDSSAPALNHIAYEQYPLALGNFIQPPRAGR